MLRQLADVEGELPAGLAARSRSDPRCAPAPGRYATPFDDLDFARDQLDLPRVVQRLEVFREVGALGALVRVARGFPFGLSG